MKRCLQVLKSKCSHNCWYESMYIYTIFMEREREVDSKTEREREKGDLHVATKVWNITKILEIWKNNSLIYY